MTKLPSEHHAKKRKFILSVVFVTACVVLVVPFIHISGREGYFADDKRMAVEATIRFHDQFNEGDYQAIYDEAAPQFQSTGKPAVLSAAMAQTKQKFGTMISPLLVADREFPGGQVRLVYNTKCQNGDATEFFIWQSDGKKAQLLQYQIAPGTVKPDQTNIP